MGEEKETKAKWEGEVCSELKEAKTEEIWSIFADFCNLHKWLPFDTCYQVEGISGQAGLIRYCSSTKTSTSLTLWVKERLLFIDPIKHVLSYEVLENNMGFKSYVATITVSPITGDCDDDGSGCKIVWSFVCDPIEGFGFDDLKQILASYLEELKEKVNDLKKSGGGFDFVY